MKVTLKEFLRYLKKIYEENDVLLQKHTKEVLAIILSSEQILTGLDIDSAARVIAVIVYQFLIDYTIGSSNDPEAIINTLKRIEESYSQGGAR